MRRLFGVKYLSKSFCAMPLIVKSMARSDMTILVFMDTVF
ncbi:hypothetical protein EVA_19152 [gut metagenome]|uniref:Uncharacterized protein n=1 Tax=gut metagenome TaxID=749906 RepID=J9FCW6_9ZZZZ